MTPFIPDNFLARLAKKLSSASRKKALDDLTPTTLVIRRFWPNTTSNPIANLRILPARMPVNAARFSA